jgi:uncharacterized protein
VNAVMTRRLFVAGLALAGLGLSAAPTHAEQPQKKAKVLFLTQSKGFEHGSVRRPQDRDELAPAEISMTQLGQQTGLFEVHCTQNAAADFTRENLQNYDIVMFYTTGDLPIAPEDLDYFLNDWLKQKGKGFIGFHSATDTYHNHEPYWDMIGGTFNGHPWNANETVTISVHDTGHPAMKPFGEEFQIRDEIYQYKNWQPEKVRVLMSLNMAKTPTKRPYHVAVAWCKPWGEGKVFVNNLGHNESTWADRRFLKSTEGAVRWILGLEEGDATPNPEVSAAQEAKARKDFVEGGFKKQ